MAKEFARKFYNSSKWKKCRSAYIGNRLLLDGGMCEVCKKEPGYIVHHKRELTPANINDVDITLNHCNLAYVCHECHNEEHSFYKSVKLLCEFDDNGQPVVPPIFEK